MSKTLRDTITVIKYDVLRFFRYSSNLLWIFVMPLVFALTGLLMVTIIGADRFDTLIGGNQSGFAYVLAGSAIFSLSNSAWKSNGNIESEKSLGTAKTNFTLPINKASYIYGLCISSILTTGIFNLLIIIVLMFINNLNGIQIVTLFGLLFLSILTFLGIALIISSISLAFTKLGGLTSILTFALQMVTGMIIPLRAFPSTIQLILRRLPTSLAIDSIRSVLLHLKPLDNLSMQIMLLSFYALSFNILGYFLCKMALKRIKIKGTIDIY